MGLKGLAGIDAGLCEGWIGAVRLLIAYTCLPLTQAGYFRLRA